MLSLSDLEHVFAGFSASRFRAEHFERCPVHIPGALEAGPYRGLFDAAGVERVLTFGNIHASEIEVIKDGAVCAVPHLFTSRGGIKLAVIDRLFRSGHHFRLLGIQRRDRLMSELSLVLSKAFLSAVPVNAYISPPRSQGFRPHYDCHDVFVVQTVGHKRWNVYASDGGTPTLPLPEQDFVPERDGHRHGDVVAQYVLEEGDVLYLPRGMFHAASTTSSASVHLTFAIRPPTWASILELALRDLFTADAELRKFPIREDMAELTDDQVEHVRSAIARHLDKDKLTRLVARQKSADFVMPQRLLSWLQSDGAAQPDRP